MRRAKKHREKLRDGARPTRPGRNGGSLRSGNPGNKGGTGRPPSAFRASMLIALEESRADAVIEGIISGDIHEQLGADRKGRPIVGITRNSDRLAAIKFAAHYAYGAPPDELDGPDEGGRGRVTFVVRREAQVPASSEESD